MENEKQNCVLGLNELNLFHNSAPTMLFQKYELYCISCLASLIKYTFAIFIFKFTITFKEKNFILCGYIE